MSDVWSELPGDILEKIHQRFVYYDDKFRFRCVCTNWRSSSPGLLQPPWLLWPYKYGPIGVVFNPLGPLGSKVYEVDLPGGSTNAFLGSHHGWVVALQRKRFINVVNPISRVIVPLPPSHTFPDAQNEYRAKDWLGKIVISGNPSCRDFKAVALYKRNRLAYCKAGDKEWHKMVSFDDPFRVNDIAFYDEKLYVITRRDEVFVCDDIVSCPELRICCVSSPNYRNVRFRKDHLCSDGLVILARRDLGGFRLSKLDLASSSWTPMKSLVAQVLFASPYEPTEISYPIAEETRSIYYPDQKVIPRRYRSNLSDRPIWFTPDDILPLSTRKIPSKAPSIAKGVDINYRSFSFYKSVGFKAIAKDDLMQFENLHAELNQQVDSEDESEEVDSSDTGGSEDDEEVVDLILENIVFIDLATNE